MICRRLASLKFSAPNKTWFSGENITALFTCHHSSLAVATNPCAGFDSMTSREQRPARAEDHYHKLMLELSKVDMKSEYPYFTDRANIAVIQNELSDAIRVMSVYEELFSQITEEDSDHILRIYSDQLMGEEKAILMSTGPSDNPSKGEPDSANGLPSKEQLHFISDSLAKQLPNIFKRPIDYKIYHKDIVFINNLRGTKTAGIVPYVKQIAMLRIFGHLRFSYVSFEILKITMHPEEGTVKVRWRINGVSALKSMLLFWNIKLWDYKKTKKELSEIWYDGFSSFVVGSDGLVHVHIADKMMPDDDRAVDTSKLPLAAKLAVLIGLVPRPSMSDFSELCITKNEIEQNMQMLHIEKKCRDE